MPTLQSLAEADDGPTDAALIAEIAPAMQDKLKREGQLIGALFAMLAIVVLPELELLDPVKAAIASALHLGPDGARRVGDYGFIFGILSAFIVLPSYFQWRAIKDELKYRRQHGKWRWEH